MRSFNSESWCSNLSSLLTSVFTMLFKGERDLSRTLFCERVLAVLGNKFMSSSGFGFYSGVFGARNGVS